MLDPFRTALVLVAAIALAATSASAQLLPGTTFLPGTVGFEVRVQGELNPYRVLGVFVQPGEVLAVRITRAPAGATFRFVPTLGALTKQGPRSIEWAVPTEPGLYPLLVERLDAAATMRLQVFVEVPLSQVRDGYLNGYRIGAYPEKPLRGLPIYRPPAGLVEVQPEHLDVEVSPHFRLRQFLCKQQQAAFPKYLVLRERLLLKLEYLLAKVNARGWETDTFFVMSGYRTPFYNAAIGNVRYSRHVWGGAADIFIDVAPRDGVMDDLNRDGKVDQRDAEALYELIETTAREQDWDPYIGGLGLYGPTAVRGPFVHVDARGFRARWGR